MRRQTLPALDWFRLVAAVLVVTIHTSPLSSLSAGADFWLTRVAARVAVPFFLMVSGYFLALHHWKNLRNFLGRTLFLYGIAILLYLPMNLYAGGFSAVGWLRAIFWEGTLYHLWYFPALFWGALLTWLLLRLGYRRALACASLLYLIGLGGDSYYGLAVRLPVLKRGYDLLFSLTEYTRNGIFYVPLFLLLGARGMRLHTPSAATGFCLSLAGMSVEAWFLRRMDAQRHDSMYLFLPVCMIFLFALLLNGNRGRSHTARDLSMLVYLLHPGCIVAVRMLARMTHSWNFLVESSLPHFVAVLMLSLLLACLLSHIRPLPMNPRARAWREIHLSALRHNAHVLMQAAGPGCELMAVVKADAYGHGARVVSQTLSRAGIRAFAVACLEEGIALRRAGIQGCILILGWTAPEQAPLLARWRLTQAVVDADHGAALSRTGYNVHVHLAVDSGMHRLGIPCEDIEALAALYQLPGIRVDGIFSHLCVSDSLSGRDVSYTSRQMSAFHRAVNQLKALGISPGKVHLLASYGMLNCPEREFDYVRAGIILYGVYSDNGPVSIRPDLKPVLSLHARVASVRELASGESAGYGLAFTAMHPTRIAVVTIGYADGLPRDMSQHGGQVLVNGCFCPMVGRLCMDQLLVDVTEAGSVQTGDTVTLIGCDGNAVIRAETVAEQCGTITNELLSRLGHRLPVVAVDPDRLLLKKEKLLG